MDKFERDIDGFDCPYPIALGLGAIGCEQCPIDPCPEDVFDKARATVGESLSRARNDRARKIRAGN